MVFQNELMQLIQYAPSTEEVLRRPLLILPPWINKFYILDLRPKNSLVRWAVAQGHTVFMISWVNPDERLSREGVRRLHDARASFAALDAIEQATGEREVNAIGYCLGGTLLADHPGLDGGAPATTASSSATFFVTMTGLRRGRGAERLHRRGAAHRSMEEQDGAARRTWTAAEMATTFNMLRANDLIWSFVVNNYLLGNEPFPFDLLYWNSDATRMPARMHSFYLRNMYHDEPAGEARRAWNWPASRIDLGRVDVPAYFLSTREDHIAPWKQYLPRARSCWAGRTASCWRPAGTSPGW